MTRRLAPRAVVTPAQCPSLPRNRARSAEAFDLYRPVCVRWHSRQYKRNESFSEYVVTTFSQFACRSHNENGRVEVFRRRTHNVEKHPLRTRARITDFASATSWYGRQMIGQSRAPHGHCRISGNRSEPRAHTREKRRPRIDNGIAPKHFRKRWPLVVRAIMWGRCGLFVAVAPRCHRAGRSRRERGRQRCFKRVHFLLPFCNFFNSRAQTSVPMLRALPQGRPRGCCATYRCTWSRFLGADEPASLNDGSFGRCLISRRCGGAPLFESAQRASSGCRWCREIKHPEAQLTKVLHKRGRAHSVVRPRGNSWPTKPAPDTKTKRFVPCGFVKTACYLPRSSLGNGFCAGPAQPFSRPPSQRLTLRNRSRILWSHLRESNSRPTVYETVALPLS